MRRIQVGALRDHFARHHASTRAKLLHVRLGDALMSAEQLAAVRTRGAPGLRQERERLDKEILYVQRRAPFCYVRNSHQNSLRRPHSARPATKTRL
jgi:hypothetical protein